MSNVFYEKKASLWWMILGFVCPIAGIILYFVFKETKADLAKKSLIGAIAMIILAVLVGSLVGLFHLFLDDAFNNVFEGTTTSVLFKL